ncbi:5-formyltetrahydrofolate cyclo-ligase [termite gut metagenome]|uniref:5-formyltetrahydrofolate cyclo-ligase n=1 Tax=termite gut metagenome TaxID=433724 RepID=A0A5J4SN05_9ZZZZ
MTEIRKKELRELIVEKKRFCCDSLFRMQSVEIFSRLETYTVFKEAHTVLLFYSLKDEPDTHSFIEKWSGEKEILLPAVCGENFELRVYNGREGLLRGAYDIQEPSGSLFTGYASIDLAVIPGVAFDRSGNRLGRGKGYYDALLPHISAYKVGVCFSFQLVEDVPTGEFDVRVDEIITSFV